jgi:hypothetical protein
MMIMTMVIIIDDRCVLQMDSPFGGFGGAKNERVTGPPEVRRRRRRQVPGHPGTTPLSSFLSCLLDAAEGFESPNLISGWSRAWKYSGFGILETLKSI